MKAQFESLALNCALSWRRAASVMAIASCTALSGWSCLGQMSMRFVGSDLAVFPTAANAAEPSTNDLYPRLFTFTPPLNFPTNFSNPPNPTEEGWSLGFPSGEPFPDGRMTHNSWAFLTNSFSTSNTCNNLTSVGGGSVQVSLDSYLWQMPMPATADDALQVALNWWATNGWASWPPEKFSKVDSQLQMVIQGGQFDGKSLMLNAALASAVVSSQYNTTETDEGIADLFFAVDWGSDPATNREFVIFHFSFYAEADVGGDTNCLPLAEVCQQWVNAPDVETYEQGMLNNLISQISSDPVFTGAMPELLFFYDFSQKYTAPVLSTIPDTSSNFNELDIYYYWANQYDAGPVFSLPTAASDTNRQGGNACGDCSLAMAMNVFGATESRIDQVYANTMQLGAGSNRANNKFDWEKAIDWLQGKTTYGTNATPFPNPLGNAVSVDSMDETKSISAAWGRVDTVLAAKQPVLIRTDLGTGTKLGGGHVVLLLGKGSSPYITQLYGGSGDYYIVNDPGGHFFANTNNNKHYLTAEQANTNWWAVNYSGWFAMYPAEAFQKRIININTTNTPYAEVRALTIGPLQFGSHYKIKAECPVAMMVTDPLGNQTGVETNGTILEGIPQSSYYPAFADSEDGESIDPDGPKTISVQSAMAGTYRVDVTGTDSGSYTLEWAQSTAAGAVLASNSYTGSISLGQQVTYFLSLPPTDPPPLLFSQQGNALVLSWTTNYVRFALQATTNLASGSGWANVNGGAVSGGFNVFTIPASSPPQFFRLKQ